MVLKQAAFGAWLKDRRKVIDYTQDELARRVGCSLMLIQKLEADERRPSKQIAELLAEHLDIPADERADFVRFARSRAVRYSPTERSPWRTLRHRLTNLPVPPTPLFGREQDITEIVRRIAREHVRLLTLVGPPGIGKTRLALECADELLDHFDDGVFHVALAPVRDPNLVAPTIAHALGVKETAGQSFTALLTAHLASKRVLILLDNFEQVVAAAPFVAEILAACPWLHILVTSRVSLHVRAERQFRVAPLALPPAGGAPGLAETLASPAVQLFVDRARSVEPAFAASPENARVLAQICARLDGLPLAIELVATRAGALGAAEILAQIERRQGLDAAGPQDLPAGHQTLGDAIAWSYELLDAEERVLFARLAVFVGGWTGEAVEQVCGDTRALPRLADQSLITLGGPRGAMLETLREYALERLEESGTADELRRRHARCYLRLAETAEPELTGPQQAEWLDRLEREHHNLRAALDWVLERGDADTALRMGGALWRFWQTHGYLGEGLELLQAALDLAPEASAASLPSARAQALLGQGWLLRDLGDFAKMKTCFEAARLLLAQDRDCPRLGYALYSAGYADYLMGDHALGIRTIEESVALYRTLPDSTGIALPLFMLGRIAVGEGAYDRALELFTESLALERQRGATFGTARTLANLGELAIYRGDYDRAGEYLSESQAMLGDLGERQLYAWVLTKRGELAWCTGDTAQARAFLESSLDLSREIGYRWNTAYTLTYLGVAAASEGAAEQAQAYGEESLALFRELGSEQDIAQTEKDLARALVQRGDCERALALYRESVPVLLRRNYLPDIADCLEGLGSLRAAQGDPTAALRAFASADALRERTHTPLPSVRRASAARTLDALRAQLGEPRAAEIWAEGFTMRLDEAVARACGGGSARRWVGVGRAECRVGWSHPKFRGHCASPCNEFRIGSAQVMNQSNHSVRDV